MIQWSFSIHTWLAITTYSCFHSTAARPWPSVCAVWDWILGHAELAGSINSHFVFAVGWLMHTGTHALKNRKIEHVLVPVAIQPQKNPTTLHLTQEVSQRVNMAARGGDHTTLSQTALRSQRATQSLRVSPQSPNHSNQQRKSKASQLGRRSVWQTWRR